MSKRKPLEAAVIKKGTSKETAGLGTSKELEECLRTVADRHGLLIMRELSMKVTKFQDIQLQTKISPHALTLRLRRLEKNGIIERHQYSNKPPRFEYFATPKGRGLDELLFAAGNWDILWGSADGRSEPSILAFDKRTGKRLGPVVSESLKTPEEEE